MPKIRRTKDSVAGVIQDGLVRLEDCTDEQSADANLNNASLRITGLPMADSRVPKGWYLISANWQSNLGAVYKAGDIVLPDDIVGHFKLAVPRCPEKAMVITEGNHFYAFFRWIFVPARHKQFIPTIIDCKETDYCYRMLAKRNETLKAYLRRTGADAKRFEQREPHYVDDILRAQS